MFFPVVFVFVQVEAVFFFYSKYIVKLEIMSLPLMGCRFADSDEAAAVVDKSFTAVMIVSFTQYSPPLCAVSASPTLITTSKFFSRSLFSRISSKLMKETSNGAPLKASMIPK